MATLTLYKGQETVIVEEGTPALKGFIDLGFSLVKPEVETKVVKAAKEPLAVKE